MKWLWKFLTGSLTSVVTEPPWIKELRSVYGKHEGNDVTFLKAWLYSDGKSLGDPRKFPWCGDAMETAMKRSLPSEPFIGKMKENPYWARNWLYFGKPCKPRKWAIVVFSRGIGGHVSTIIAEDDDFYYCLGGNQSNSINIAAYSKINFLGCVWPVTNEDKPQAIPRWNAETKKLEGF